MSDIQVSQEVSSARTVDTDPSSSASQKTKWEMPRLEDVSEQVMAQPYIRFT